MNRKASLLFIFATVAIDSIGIGIIIPVLPDVIRRFVADEATVSRLYGYFVATYALMQFFCSPLLGRLSDRFGRRPVLLASLLGGGIDYLFMAFAPALPLLFLGRVISGMSGASFTVAGAYIADVSDDANRAKNFGVIGAGFGVGFVAGPAIGGLLAAYGSHVPFVAAALFNLANFLFGCFILPESLRPENRRAFDRRELSPFRSLGRVIARPKIRALVLVYCLLVLAGNTHPSIWTLYTEHRFGWTPAQVGVSLAAVGVLSMIAQGFLTGFWVRRFGEGKVLVWSCLGEAMCFAAFGLVPRGWMIYPVLVLSSLFWSGQPALQSLISREVPAQEQGELQGSLMSLGSIMAIVNPLVMTSLFAWTSAAGARFYLPGAPYVLAGGMILVAWAVLYPRRRRWAAPIPAVDAAP